MVLSYMGKFHRFNRKCANWGETQMPSVACQDSDYLSFALEVQGQNYLDKTLSQGWEYENAGTVKRVMCFVLGHGYSGADTGCTHLKAVLSQGVLSGTWPSFPKRPVARPEFVLWLLCCMLSKNKIYFHSHSDDWPFAIQSKSIEKKNRWATTIIRSES